MPRKKISADQIMYNLKTNKKFLFLGKHDNGNLLNEAIIRKSPSKQNPAPT